MTQYNYIGIDVAKDKFDVCLLANTGKSHEGMFNNTEAGYKSFIKWIKLSAETCWICMEATGQYSEVLAEHLVSKGYKVSVENPVKIKYFTKAKLSRNKNDKVDARLIAEYAQLMTLKLFQPKSREQKYIRELLQFEEQLKKQKSQLKRQSSCITSREVKKQIEKTVKMLDKQLAQIGEQLETVFKRNERLQQCVDLLVTIKGMGELSARRFLAYLPDISLFSNAKQLAAFIGVSPKQNESGLYRGKTTMSKMGNPRLRNVLYMPALNAKRFNLALQPFVKRLEAKGLAPKAIVGAIMRKLVHIIYGMLKSNRTFDPSYV